MEKNQGYLALIDEDPDGTPIPYFDRTNFTSVIQENGYRIKNDSRRGHTIIEIQPYLEEWVLDVCDEASVNIRNYNLPNNPILLHHIINNVRCERMATQLRSRIMKFAANDEYFKKSLELLLTLPNVGITTALTILIEIVDIQYFWRSKSLVKWSGLAPRVNQSGHRKRKTGRIYKGGNKWLRRAVWITAKNCYAHYNESDEPIGAFVNRLYNHKHKHYFTAVTAGARKLVSYIYQVLTQQRPFEEVFEFEHLNSLKKIVNAS